MSRESVWDGGVASISEGEWEICREDTILSGRVFYRNARVLVTTDTEIIANPQVFDAVRVSGVKLDSESISARVIEKLSATEPLHASCRKAKEGLEEIGLGPSHFCLWLAALKEDNNRAVDEHERRLERALRF